MDAMYDAQMRGGAISDLTLQQLVLGYDLLALIPEAMAATQIFPDQE